MSLIAEKHKAEAAEFGLRIVGESKNKGYKLYQFIECGHVAEKSTSCVRKNSVACKQCSEDRHAKDALGKGLRLVGRSKKDGYWKYRWMSCRHICEYTPQNVRLNKVTCGKCATQWSRK